MNESSHQKFWHWLPFGVTEENGNAVSVNDPSVKKTQKDADPASLNGPILQTDVQLESQRIFG